MANFGILTRAQYLSLGEKRCFSGARVAYNLLRVSEHPTPEEIRTFEDICVTLRTSNGTFRTTFRNRFPDVDAKAMEWIGRSFDPAAPLSVQDRAVSSGLTSYEWAQVLFRSFPAAQFEASDLLVELLELSLDNGETYIVEPNGAPLQYIQPPYVVALYHPESWRNPWLRWVGTQARKRFDSLPLPKDWMRTASGPGYKVAHISCVHPEAQLLARTHPNFRFQVRSVFDRMPGACHVMRTMNILNPSYFSPEQLREGFRTVFDTLQPGGLWIAGRTLEEDLSNHVSFLRRLDKGWEVLDRIGKGWELEESALGSTR